MKIEDLERFQATKRLPKTFIEEIPNLVAAVINRECNLNCKHCDWPLKHSVHEEYLSSQDWNSSIKNFSLTGSKKKKDKTIVISGREPLYDQDSREKLMSVLASSRAQGIYAGFITNGINLPFLFKEYPNFIPDFMDISLEGPKEINDQIRGAGFFEKAMAGFKLALQKVEKLFISITVTAINIQAIPSFIQDMVHLGVKQFVFHSLVPGEFVAPGIQTEDDDFLEMIKKIKQLADKLKLEQVIFDLYPPSFKNFPRIIEEIKPEELFVDNYIVMSLAQNVFVRFVNLLESYTVSFLVSPEGYVVTPLEMRMIDYLKNKENRQHIQNILAWDGNPYANEIIKLAKNISDICFEQKCFKFCLGQNSFCPITKKRRKK